MHRGRDRRAPRSAPAPATSSRREIAPPWGAPRERRFPRDGGGSFRRGRRAHRASPTLEVFCAPRPIGCAGDACSAKTSTSGPLLPASSPTRSSPRRRPSSSPELSPRGRWAGLRARPATLRLSSCLRPGARLRDDLARLRSLAPHPLESSLATTVSAARRHSSPARSTLHWSKRPAARRCGGVKPFSSSKSQPRRRTRSAVRAPGSSCKSSRWTPARIALQISCASVLLS